MEPRSPAQLNPGTPRQDPHQLIPDAMSQLNHLARLGRAQSTTAIEVPKLQPMSQMLRANPQLQVGGTKPASISRRPTSLTRPELADFRQVRRPVLNVGVKNRPQHPVLADISIKVVQQQLQSFLPA